MKMEDSKCNELQTQNHKPLVWKRGGAGKFLLLRGQGGCRKSPLKTKYPNKYYIFADW